MNQEEIEEVINSLSLSVISFSEFEGFACGWLISKMIGQNYWDAAQWLTELTVSYGPQDDSEFQFDSREELILLAYFQQVVASIDERDYRLSVVLQREDEDVSLYLRVNQLKDWLSGFVFGLGVAGGVAGLRSKEIGELMEDLGNFSRIELDESHFSPEESETDEADFLEIEEYARLLLFYLLEEIPATESKTAETTLH